MIRKLSVGALVAMLALALVGCGTAASPTPTVSLKVQLSWAPSAQFTGMIVADAKGYYEEEGLDVELLRQVKEVDRARIPEVLSSVLSRFNVEDVGVQERPLEEVIAEFFTTNAATQERDR